MHSEVLALTVTPVSLPGNPYSSQLAEVVHGTLQSLDLASGAMTIQPSPFATAHSAKLESKSQVLMSDEYKAQIKDIMQDFLSQCNYEYPCTPPDIALRGRLRREVAEWDAGLNPKHAEKLVDTSCHFAETAYGHLSRDHCFFVARYTAYFIYADDFGGEPARLNALREFSRRFANKERQLDPVLERLAEMVRGADALWTDVGASAIISGTLDALSGFYVEFTTQGMVVKPGAVRYPDYLRLKSGIDPPFIAFMFMRGWRSSVESYVQLLPEMEFWIGAANDVLSFYKEELAHETNNYTQMRAAMEQTSAIAILRKLADEVVETTHRIERLAADDAELSALWHGYKQRFIEFQVKAPRYRLSELGLTD
ncbi:terpenoid synthase [Trametes polyzona]|nr:terpenoid synthase [Trametes polyzona]